MNISVSMRLADGNNYIVTYTSGNNDYVAVSRTDTNERILVILLEVNSTIVAEHFDSTNVSEDLMVTLHNLQTNIEYFNAKIREYNTSK